MAYVGTPIDTQNQFQSLQGKRFNGDASTTDFTLDIAPNSVFDIEVFVENVRQDPNSAYTLNGTTLTFSAAPPSGTNNIYVIHQAKAVGTITAPVGGSIVMNGVELISDEDGDTSITADTDDQIDFKTGGTDRVIIDSSGNVGIGETSPTEALHISSTSNDKPILILENNEPGTGDGRLYSKHLSASPADDDGLGQVRFIGKNDADEEIYYARFFGKSTDVSDGTEDGELRFLTYNAGTETNTLTLKSGKVGVGTTSPTTELYVDGAGSGTFSPYNDPLIVEGDSYTIGLHLKGVNSQAMIIYNRDGTNGWFTGLENSGHYKFSPMTAMNGTAVGNAKDDGNPPLMLKTDDTVLMGTTSTTINTSNFGAKIISGLLSTSGNVNGSSTSAEHFGNAGQIRFMGDGDAENTNNSYGALSDRTLKENETDANSQWNDIKALQIKNYNLIEYPDRPQIGVIAQDLEDAGMNGLVKTDDEGLKSVKYSVLYMKAVKALQEALIEIDNLKARVDTLEGN